MNETDLNTIVVNCKLDALKDGRNVTFSTKGISMAPFIRNGDRIVVSDCDINTLKPGDIISFQSIAHNKIIAHRIIKKIKTQNTPMFITKGDSLPMRDKPPIAGEKIVGKVIEIQKPSFNIRLNSASGKALNLCMLAFSISRITYLIRNIYITARPANPTSTP